MADVENQEQPEELTQESPEAEIPEQLPAEDNPPVDPDAPPEGEESDESAEEKPEGEPEAKAEEKKPHGRPGGYVRKLQRLQEQNQMLLEQLTAQRGQQPKPADEAKPKDPAAQVEEYVSRVVEQRLAAAEEQRRQAQARADFQKRTAEFSAANPDFEEVVDSVSHIPVPSHLQQLVLNSPEAPAIMYSLAKNTAELSRLSDLPPLDAAREIGRLEAKLASSTAAPVKPKSASRPPAPPTSVGGSSASTRSLDDLPLAEYKRRMRSGGR